MGGRGRLAAVLLAAALLSPPARGETQAEPVARVTIEGAHDSNVLFDGRADEKSRISPEAGLRVHDHLWSLVALYGLDYVQYRRLQPDGVWNHRGEVAFAATPTERTRATGAVRGAYARDPLGLAQAGVFRAGQERAVILRGGARAEYAIDRTLLLAGDLTERLVRFEDRTGGAMHAPSLELLRALSPRLMLGGAVSSSVFQDFERDESTVAYAQAVRGRVRYRLTHFLEADAFAGPAFWSGPEGTAVVPEAGVDVRLTQRDWDLRASVSHRLGLGSTAAPSLGDSLEFGTERRFGRKFDLRADGGLWHAGEVPTGRDATVWYAVAAEGGWYVTRELRIAVAASHLSRLDDSSPLLRRTTIGIRMGWELPHR